MKQIVVAAALLTISAAAHAGTYHVESVTIHVQDGCRSSSCVSVYAPEYGYYHGGGAPRVHKAHKDNSRFAAVAKKDDAAPAPAAAAPEAAAPATEATPAKVLGTAPAATPQPAPTDAAPAK